MPIHFATEPKNGTTLVHDGLGKLSRRESPLSKRAVDFKALRLSSPHAVYDLQADKVIGGGGLASATMSGYRYLVLGGEASVAAAEVQVNGEGTATLLTHINHGPYVEATAKALSQVAALAPVGGASYEVRLLRFSAIFLMALWLKPDSKGADILYPLTPAPPGLQAERSYSEDDFMKAIRPLAEKRAGKKGPQVP